MAKYKNKIDYIQKFYKECSNGISYSLSSYQAGTFTDFISKVEKFSWDEEDYYYDDDFDDMDWYDWREYNYNLKQKFDYLLDPPPTFKDLLLETKTFQELYNIK